MARLLDKLPGTLEELVLVAPSWDFAFLNFAPTATDYDHRFMETEYDRGTSRFVDVEALFPRLVALKVGSESLEENRLLAALLSSLTTLLLPTCFVQHKNPNLMTYLPRSLTELHTSIDIRVALEDDWIQAPPHLQHISTLQLDCNNFPLKWLPKSLTSGSIIIAPPTLPSFEQLQDLPPALSDLRYCCPGVPIPNAHAQSWLSLLPNSLTKLEVTPNSDAPVFGANLANLPRTLTDLVLYHPVDWKGLSAAHAALQNPSDFWPSGLVKLKVELPSFAKRHFQLLPRSLTWLKLHIGVEMLFLHRFVFNPVADHTPPADVLAVVGEGPNPTSQACTIYADEMPKNLRRLSLLLHTSDQLVINGTLPRSLTQVSQTSPNRSNPTSLAQADREKCPSLTKLTGESWSLAFLPRSAPWTLPSHLLHFSFRLWKAAWLSNVEKSFDPRARRSWRHELRREI